MINAKNITLFENNNHQTFIFFEAKRSLNDELFHFVIPIDELSTENPPPTINLLKIYVLIDEIKKANVNHLK